MTYENRFEGRSAIVTGGASGIGIGLDVASRLAREGARVTVWDLRAGTLPGGFAAHAVPLDVSDPVQVAKAMALSVEALGGKFDILIASAGITGSNTTVREHPVAAWQ